MTTNLREEIRRMKNHIMKLYAEIGGKNQKMEYFEKQLKEGATSLSEMKEEIDQLSEDYKEEKRKVIMTVLENERLEREIVVQKKAIEQQAKEIKKRDSQLDFKKKQILVLRMLKESTEAPLKVNDVQGKCGGVENMSSRDNAQLQIGLHQAPQKVNTVHAGRHEGVQNMSGGDKVQIQIYTNGLQHQAAQKVNTVQGKHQGVENRSGQDKKVQPQIDMDCLHIVDQTEEKDSELSQKQTLGDKEHKSNHELQKAHEVSTEENGEEDDDSSVYILDDWRLSDCDWSEGEEECNSFKDTVPPVPPPESSVDPSNDLQNNNSGLSVIIPDSNVQKRDECGKGDTEGSGGVECNAFEESLVDPCSDMLNNCSDPSMIISVAEVKRGDECGKGDIEGSGGVECNAFEDMFASCSDFSFVLPDPSVKKGDVAGSEGVEFNAFQDVFPQIGPPEFLVDLCSDMPNNCSDFSFLLPDPDCEMTNMDRLSTLIDDSMSVGDITMGMDFSGDIIMGMDFSHSNMNDDSAAVLRNVSSSCSGGMIMPLTADTVVLDSYSRMEQAPMILSTTSSKFSSLS